MYLFTEGNDSPSSASLLTFKMMKYGGKKSQLRKKAEETQSGAWTLRVANVLAGVVILLSVFSRVVSHTRRQVGNLSPVLLQSCGLHQPSVQ